MIARASLNERTMNKKGPLSERAFIKFLIYRFFRIVRSRCIELALVGLERKKRILKYDYS